MEDEVVYKSIERHHGCGLNGDSKDIDELLQLAELGRLALTTQICYWGYDYADGDCQEGKCERNLLCRVRAEMLRGNNK